ncbi:MAG: sigma-70 family RNA polymerase sigma factor [Chlorobi bacterium]|nr:sigma-70 family RNA polymerase sigma factor [Chlorobiota bacterium]
MSNNKGLWDSYKEMPNSETKKQIMVNYTNLVHYVIHNFKFMSLDVIEEKDYFQFGVEGLSEAIDRFDPDYGTKFETYAIQRIRGKIIDELRKLQIKPRSKTSEGDMKYHNVSLDQPLANDQNFTLNDVIPADFQTPEQLTLEDEKKRLLVEAIKRLSERDRLIISLYYFENLNYKEIAEIIDITVSRVSQIHSKVIKELKSIFDAKYGEKANG